MSHARVLRDDAKCFICLDLLVKPVTFPCQHEVCFACYQETVDKANLSCPFCRKRLSVWCRTATRLKTLIDENRWKEICDLYPAQVRRALQSAADSAVSCSASGGLAIAGNENDPSCSNNSQDDEEVTFEMECEAIKRIIAAPGEIKQEFEYFIAMEEKMRHKERQKEEEQSLKFIESRFSEETAAMTRKRLMEEEDEALARSLQRDLDQEEERIKKANRKSTSRPDPVLVQQRNRYEKGKGPAVLIPALEPQSKRNRPSYKQYFKPDPKPCSGDRICKTGKVRSVFRSEPLLPEQALKRLRFRALKDHSYAIRPSCSEM